MDASPHVAREVGKDLRLATDQQLSRVVAIVDSMSARGAADDLIELVRPRLATLRPERPLTLSRVLFAPLDPAIVQSRHWRPGTAAIPRSALSVISRDVIGGLGGLSSELRQVAEGACWNDRTKLRQIGVRLWPGAAEAVRSMIQPKDWREQTGLPDEIWVEIQDTLALMLSVAVRMESILASGEGDPELRALLVDHRACSESTFAVLVRVLLARHHDPAAVLRAVATLRDGQTARARELAVSSIIADTPATIRTIVEARASSAVEEAIQLASMLDAVETAETQDRVRKLRARALDACQVRLERCIEEDVMSPLQGSASDVEAALSGAEDGARDASRIDKATRAFGGRQQAQKLLKSVSERLLTLVAEGVDAVDRARLVEILLGPEEALLIENALSGTQIAH